MVLQRPLLFVGNKRSGTSVMVRVLNMATAVAVTPESDVMWALYQMHHGQPLRRHEWDGAVGLSATLRACPWITQGHDRERTKAEIRELFLRIQSAVLNRADPAKASRLGELSWLGDKKPVQH